MREKDLVPHAKNFLKERFNFPNDLIFEEVASPWGRPDLVAVGSEPLPSTPLQPIGRTAWGPLLTLERYGPLSLDALANKLGTSERNLANLLSLPISRGLVQVNHHTVGLRRSLPPHLKHICAVEIKTRDWMSGLRQALRYKTFADEVQLFLGRAGPRIKTDMFREARVGLVRIGSEPEILVESRATWDENIPLSRLLVEDRIRGLAHRATQRPS